MTCRFSSTCHGGTLRLTKWWVRSSHNAPRARSSFAPQPSLQRPFSGWHDRQLNFHVIILPNAIFLHCVAWFILFDTDTLLLSKSLSNSEASTKRMTPSSPPQMLSQSFRSNLHPKKLLRFLLLRLTFVPVSWFLHYSQCNERINTNHLVCMKCAIIAELHGCVGASGAWVGGELRCRVHPWCRGWLHCHCAEDKEGARQWRADHEGQLQGWRAWQDCPHSRQRSIQEEEAASLPIQGQELLWICLRFEIFGSIDMITNQGPQVHTTTIWTCCIIEENNKIFRWSFVVLFFNLLACCSSGGFTFVCVYLKPKWACSMRDRWEKVGGGVWDGDVSCLLEVRTGGRELWKEELKTSCCWSVYLSVHCIHGFSFSNMLIFRREAFRFCRHHWQPCYSSCSSAPSVLSLLLIVLCIWLMVTRRCVGTNFSPPIAICLPIFTETLMLYLIRHKNSSLHLICMAAGGRPNQKQTSTTKCLCC